MVTNMADMPFSHATRISGDKAFMDWMRLVNSYQAAGGTEAESFHGFRKDLKIEMYNLVNEKVLELKVSNCWPSKVVLGEWDAAANELAIEMLELQHEGWVIGDRAEYADER